MMEELPSLGVSDFERRGFFDAVSVSPGDGEAGVFRLELFEGDELGAYGSTHADAVIVGGGHADEAVRMDLQPGSGRADFRDVDLLVWNGDMGRVAWLSP